MLKCHVQSSKLEEKIVYNAVLSVAVTREPPVFSVFKMGVGFAWTPVVFTSIGQSGSCSAGGKCLPGPRISSFCSGRIVHTRSTRCPFLKDRSVILSSSLCCMQRANCGHMHGAGEEGVQLVTLVASSGSRQALCSVT